ncbi:MAG: hypothetical protein ABSA58_19815 [Acetobacteraceae bacterium]|jgi:hypothetical protein
MEIGLSSEQMLSFFIWFALIFGVVGAVSAKGFSFGLPIIVVSAIWLVAFQLVGANINSGNIMIYAGGFAAATVLGIILGQLLRWKLSRTLKSKLTDLSFSFINDPRYIVIMTAIAVAIIATFVFAKITARQPPGTFWHGFYEAWTASIVFFAIIGLAGTAVALYRPEKEDLKTRVRILCGGQQRRATDYIYEEVKFLGYYAEKIVRNYRVLNYDPLRNAFEVEVEQITYARNFYDDEATDTARLAITMDELTPSLDPIGNLRSITVDGRLVEDVTVNQVVVRLPIPVPVGGLVAEWSLHTPRGKTAEVKTLHSAWFDAREEHTFGSHRFVEEVEFCFIYEASTPQVCPPITYTAYKQRRSGRSIDTTKEVAHQTEISPNPLQRYSRHQRSCLPGSPAFSFRFGAITEPAAILEVTELEAVR